MSAADRRSPASIRSRCGRRGDRRRHPLTAQAVEQSSALRWIRETRLLEEARARAASGA